jgi:outer membrane protein insertion porin family
MKNSWSRGYRVVWVLLIIFASSCGPSKYLQDDELLFDDVEINMESDAGFIQKRSLKNKLSRAVEPAPTNKTLGLLRIRQWFYSIYSEDIPEKGFKNWVKYRLGEPPQIYKNEFAGRNLRNFQNLLFNHGYFLNEVEANEMFDKKKVTLVFDVKTNEAFLIDTIVFPDTTGLSMNKIIYNNKSKSSLEQGDQYSIDNLEKETKRINRLLKNNGYYYFNPDYIIFKIDTVTSKHQVDLFLEYTSNMPERATKIWKLSNTYINTAHKPGSTVSEQSDTLLYKKYHIVYENRYIKPEPLVQSVLLEPGEVYKISDHESTLNKLTGLGVFRFVNTEFSAVENVDSSVLKTSVNLTRQVPRSIQVELQAVTKSNDYTGPNLNASYRDRNLLNGAESFEVRANAGFETQFSNTTGGLNSYKFGVETDLTIPRFIVPFIDANQLLAKRYIPKSSFNTDISLTRRINYFRMNSARLSWGYIWQETINKKHSVYPFNLNYINITERTAIFDSLLTDRPLLEQSFREQFILSLMYSYQRNVGQTTPGNFSSYFHVNTEIAGNSISLFNRVVHDDEKNDFFGTPYSQFAKAQTDLRLYYHMRNSSIANRWILGIGIPYGNSQTLPYNRQFFIGGTSSIRAFRSRSIGPGTYEPDATNVYSFEQSGDLKFEANLEYRFKIYRFLKGAFFYDVGNIWLLNDDEDKPGGQFALNDFFRELAMGTGFGLRVDANFLVFRLDIGVPLREPYKPLDERWVFNDISFNDLVLNIAIGYPF